MSQLPEFSNPQPTQSDRNSVAERLRDILSDIYREAEKRDPDTVQIRHWVNTGLVLTGFVVLMQGKLQECLPQENEAHSLN